MNITTIPKTTAYQTVEIANGSWDVFSIVTGESVKVVQTKAEAVALVATMNRHNTQVLDVIGSLLRPRA